LACRPDGDAGSQGLDPPRVQVLLDVSGERQHRHAGQQSLCRRASAAMDHHIRSLEQRLELHSVWEYPHVSFGELVAEARIDAWESADDFGTGVREAGEEIAKAGHAITEIG